MRSTLRFFKSMSSRSSHLYVSQLLVLLIVVHFTLTLLFHLPLINFVAYQ